MINQSSTIIVVFIIVKLSLIWWIYFSFHDRVSFHILYLIRCLCFIWFVMIQEINLIAFVIRWIIQRQLIYNDSINQRQFICNDSINQRQFICNDSMNQCQFICNDSMNQSQLICNNSINRFLSFSSFLIHWLHKWSFISFVFTLKFKRFDSSSTNFVDESFHWTTSLF